jgi:HSP20 family protein
MNTLTFARNTALARNLLDDFLAEVERSPRASAFRPAVDIAEIDGAYVLRMDLPGVAREDVKLETKDGALTVSGTRKAPEAGKAYRYCESGYGAFSRSFSLPESIDRDSIGARLENGVLEVRLALRPEVGPKRVEIA